MKIDREETLRTLGRLKPALMATASIPELQHFWANNGTVSAYDGGLGIRVDLKLGFEGGVPGAALLGLLDSSSVDQVTLNEPDKSQALGVSLGRAHAKLALLPSKNNPWHFPDKVPLDAWEIKLKEDALTALSQVLLVKASQPVRAEHHGVVFYPTKKGIFLYTTDDISLARAFIPGKLPEDSPILIPRQFLSEVAKQCSAGARLLLLNDCVMAEEPGLRLCSHLLEAADVLKLEEILAPYLEGVVAVPIPEGLDEALKRALIMARGEMPLVKITAEKGEMTLFARYPLGEFTETLTVEDECAGEVVVRADLLLKLLGNVDTIAISESDALVLRGEHGLVYVLSGAGA